VAIGTRPKNIVARTPSDVTNVHTRQSGETSSAIAVP
jgi:hypothetical protein